MTGTGVRVFPTTTGLYGNDGTLKFPSWGLGTVSVAHSFGAHLYVPENTRYG